MTKDEIVRALVTNDQKLVIDAFRTVCNSQYNNCNTDSFEVEPYVSMRVKFQYGADDIDVTIEPGGNVVDNMTY